MSLKKNFVYNFIYHMLIMVIPLITMPYVARVIGVEGVGIYSYTHAIANYFVLFAMMGLNNYGNREIAKVRDNKILLSKTFWSIYLLQFFTALIAIVFYLLYVLYVNVHLDIFLIQTIFVVSAMFDINWLFFGLEKFKLTVVRNTLIKVVTILMLFIFVKNETDLATYTIIMALSFPLSQFILWPYLKRIVFWSKPSLNDILNHIKPNIILFIPVISVSIYKIMDKVMLGLLSNVIQVGYYEYAEKINYVQISIATALGTVMLPRMSNLVAKGDHNKNRSLIRDSMQFVMFLSIGLCFGIIFLSEKFIPLFLGNEFTPSSVILMLLAPTGVFISWANVIRTQYLLPNNKDQQYTLSVVCGAIVNLAFNLILIPKWGAVGAAFGTIFAELTVMLYQTISVRKFLDIGQYIKETIIFIPIGAFMVLSLILIDPYIEDSITGIIIECVIGASVYIILTIIYFVTFNKDRYNYFKQLVKR